MACFSHRCTIYYINLLIFGLQNHYNNLSFYVIEYQKVSLMDQNNFVIFFQNKVEMNG